MFSQKYAEVLASSVTQNLTASGNTVIADLVGYDEVILE
jgi:hypothetical protein